MRPDVREKVLAALRPEKGMPALDRVINLHGPLDFRGEAGAEPWALALAAGNWAAAAGIAAFGYEPPGQEALAAYLVRHRLDAVDCHGLPPAERLHGLLAMRTTDDDAAAGPLAALLRLAAPWPAATLNAGLFVAAAYGRNEVILRPLLAAGADLECRWESLAEEAPGHPGATPLLAAAAQPHAAHVAPWLACGADPRAVDAGGRSALHWCARHGHTAAVRALLASGLSPQDLARTDAAGQTPLAASLAGHGRILHLLLAAGAPPPAPGQELAGAHPGALVRLAVYAGVPLPATPEGARQLLGTLPGYTRRAAGSIEQAIAAGYPELAQLLLTAGGSFGPPDSLSRTALHHAALHADLPAVRLLLSHGVAVDARDHQGCTPLLLSAAAGEDTSGAVTGTLLAAGADPAAAAADGRTALHASRRDAGPTLAAAEQLLAAGAPVDAVRGDGETPLEAALRAGRADLVRVLLAAGADPDGLPGAVFPPLGYCGTVEALELLLAARASTAAGRAGVGAAAHRQAAYGSAEVFTRLIAAIADPARLRHQGETPLHQAAWADHREGAPKVRLLLARGCDPNAQDDARQTPLMNAARFGTPEAIELLLAAGARPGSRDAQDRDAADHAREKGRWKLADRLDALA